MSPQPRSQKPSTGGLPHPIRRYYRLRAKVATYKMYSKSRTNFFLRIAMTYLKIQLKVILFKADKIALLRLYTAALADGWRGRFGKTAGETDLD